MFPGKHHYAGTLAFTVHCFSIVRVSYYQLLLCYIKINNIILNASYCFLFEIIVQLEVLTFVCYCSPTDDNATGIVCQAAS